MEAQPIMDKVLSTLYAQGPFKSVTGSNDRTSDEGLGTALSDMEGDEKFAWYMYMIAAGVCAVTFLGLL